jgi:hypothetical protein
VSFEELAAQIWAEHVRKLAHARSAANVPPRAQPQAAGETKAGAIRAEARATN